MKNKKFLNFIFGLIITISVLAIIVVILDNIKITPTKVYRDKQYHFSLKYPAYWTVKPRPENGLAVVAFVAPLSSEKDVFGENVNITTVDLSRNPKWQNLSGFSKVTTQQLIGTFGEYFNVYEGKEIRMGALFGLFGGVPAFRFGYMTINKTGATGTKMKYVHVWTLRGKTAFILTFVGNQKDFNKNLKHFDRMVRTFKFEK